MLTHEVALYNDISELNTIFKRDNYSTGTRLPHNIIMHQRVRRSELKPGWNYWSVRSISPLLKGSAWSAIDSFFVDSIKIIGKKSVCINSKYRYKVDHDYANISDTVWSIGDYNLIENNGYVEVEWTHPGFQSLQVILLDQGAVVDTVNLEVKVKVYPEFNVVIPQKACVGSTVILEDNSENSKDLTYHWWVVMRDENQIIIDGLGEDSIGFVMPDIRTTVLLANYENENYCSTRFGTDEGYAFHHIQPLHSADIVGDFSADELSCGKELAQIKLETAYDESNNYHWDVDGAEVVSNQSDSLLLLRWNDFAEKKISLNIESYGCVSDTIQRILQRKPIPSIEYDMQSINCHHNQVPLVYSGSASSNAQFTWDFDGADQIDGQGKGPYDLVWNTGGVKKISLSVDDGGCVADSSFLVEISEAASVQNLSAVSVNSQNQAVLFWENSDDENIDSVFLYRESNQSNNYTCIASFSASEASSFTDTATDCSEQPYRFKLAVKDTCGYESGMSPYHKSMHLMLNKGLNSSWNLVWTDYEGLEVGTYSIYRGSSPENMYKISDVSGNVYSFTDQNPPAGDLYYTVAASNILSNSNAHKSGMLDPIVIQSNFVETKVFSVMSDVVFKQLFTLHVDRKVLHVQTESSETYSYELKNIAGQTIYFSEPLSGSIHKDLSHLQSGFYIVVIDISGDRKMVKIKL